MTMKRFQRYLGMSVRAATVVTVAAVILFSVFGSMHWRLWWLVPPVWLLLFGLSLLLAPVVGLRHSRGFIGRVPWLTLLAVSLGALAAVIFGIEAPWTRTALALLAAAGAGAGMYGVRVPLMGIPGGKGGKGGKERRRNLSLRSSIDELLGELRRMNRIAEDLQRGEMPAERATESLDEVEARVKDLVAEIRSSLTAKR